MKKNDSQEWILRTMRRILAESGPKTARRFLDSRGGTARHEQAARELARHNVAQQSGSFSSRLYQVFKRGCLRICRDCSLNSVKIYNYLSFNFGILIMMHSGENPGIGSIVLIGSDE